MWPLIVQALSVFPFVFDEQALIAHSKDLSVTFSRILKYLRGEMVEAGPYFFGGFKVEKMDRFGFCPFGLTSWEAQDRH